MRVNQKLQFVAITSIPSVDSVPNGSAGRMPALPESRLDALCAAIADIMGRVLDIDAAALDLDAPHQRYGVDSILAVAIIERINTTLGLRLRSTDFFNFATIRELALHILEIQPEETEATLLDVFQRVAAGELDLEAANRLILEQGFE